MDQGVGLVFSIIQRIVILILIIKWVHLMGLIIIRILILMDPLMQMAVLTFSTIRRANTTAIVYRDVIVFDLKVKSNCYNNPMELLNLSILIYLSESLEVNKSLRLKCC